MPISKGNPNHDPKNGEFTSGSGGSSSSYTDLSKVKGLVGLNVVYKDGSSKVPMHIMSVEKGIATVVLRHGEDSSSWRKTKMPLSVLRAQAEGDLGKEINAKMNNAIRDRVGRSHTVDQRGPRDEKPISGFRKSFKKK